MAIMKKRILTIFLLLLPFIISAQEITNRGTIKVEKKGNIKAVVFDNVNLRLVAIDTYGNMNDTAVIAFRIKTTIKGVAYDEPTEGASLSKEMRYLLSRVDGATLIYFSEIKVKDKYGNLINWPDFKSKIGHSFEKEE